MNDIETCLVDNDYEQLEIILKHRLLANKNVDTLFEYALVRLLFPFVDDDSAIYYLNEILKLEKNNFEALIIKLYLQNYYCGMDSDYDVLVSRDWNDNRKYAICDYITSWKFYDDENLKRKYLESSIEKCPDFVFTYRRLGHIYMKNGMFKEANKCFKSAKKNVVTNEFSLYFPIDKVSYIEEHILGIRITEEVERFIDKDIELSNFELNKND